MEGFLKFVAGSALGVAVGASIASLLAPRSGAELQADTHAFVAHVKTEGEIARQEAEAAVAERYRQRVQDPTAFTTSS